MSSKSSNYRLVPLKLLVPRLFAIYGAFALFVGVAALLVMVTMARPEYVAAAVVGGIAGFAASRTIKWASKHLPRMDDVFCGGTLA